MLGGAPRPAEISDPLQLLVVVGLAQGTISCANEIAIELVLRCDKLVRQLDCGIDKLRAKRLHRVRHGFVDGVAELAQRLGGGRYFRFLPGGAVMLQPGIHPVTARYALRSLERRLSALPHYERVALPDGTEAVEPKTVLGRRRQF